MRLLLLNEVTQIVICLHLNIDASLVKVTAPDWFRRSQGREAPAGGALSSEEPWYFQSCSPTVIISFSLLLSSSFFTLMFFSGWSWFFFCLPSLFFTPPSATDFFLFLLTLLIAPPLPVSPPASPSLLCGLLLLLFLVVLGEQLALLQYRLSMSSMPSQPQAPPNSGTHHSYQVHYPFNSALPHWGFMEVKLDAVAESRLLLSCRG